MKTTVIHVDQHAIRRNTKAGAGSDEPVLTCKSYKSNDRAHEAILRLPDGTEVARFVSRPHDPLACGAKVWFETKLNVEIINR